MWDVTLRAALENGKQHVRSFSVWDATLRAALENGKQHVSSFSVWEATLRAALENGKQHVRSFSVWDVMLLMSTMCVLMMVVWTKLAKLWHIVTMFTCIVSMHVIKYLSRCSSEKLEHYFLNFSRPARELLKTKHILISINSWDIIPEVNVVKLLPGLAMTFFKKFQHYFDSFQLQTWMRISLFWITL